MPFQTFDDNHFATENNGGHPCTRVIHDRADGSTEYDNLIVYRFGDRGKPGDWTSPQRRETGGGFDRPSDRTLNNAALMQVRFGRKSDLGNNVPFISVATSYAKLKEHGDPWVQNLLRVVPDLGVFVGPFGNVNRPSINSSCTKNETEWLYYDGTTPLLDYLQEWKANPYKE